mmetsp:Transcript_1823/g.7967  ORF Transcript_1823/g.7967 Transcript_1823/m.7967 type:complete len:297 (-) Transcript_1823:242-1132(-)
MRRADQVGVLDQLPELLRGRLGGIDIQRRAGDLARLEPFQEGRLVHDAAPRAVHDSHAVLALREGLLVDQVLRVRGQGRVQRDEVRLRPDALEAEHLDAVLLRRLGGKRRVEADQAHAQRLAPLGHDESDAAAADDGQRLAGDLHAGEGLSLPLARLHGDVGRRDGARHAADEAHGELRGGDRVPAGRVHDHDSASRRVRRIDVVNAHSGAPDDLEVRSGVHNLRGHLRGRAHDQAVVGMDDLAELVLGQARDAIHFVAVLLEDLHADRVDLVAAQDLGQRRSAAVERPPRHQTVC